LLKKELIARFARQLQEVLDLKALKVSEFFCDQG
jgi:hypothetical protein